MHAEPRLLAGRYRLDQPLGRGGWSEVWRGFDRSLARTVAVKVLTQRADPQALQRFQREARTLARLHHPAIVAVYDAGTDDGTAFVVMELLPGPSLAELLRRDGPLAVPLALRYAAQAADGLAAAHQAGVIHRDVKPANLVLGADGRVRVVDFGVARLEQAGSASLTMAGMVMGTPEYLSPEQAAGGAVDGRTDIYALGCVAYALLTGSPPFTGTAAVDVARQHLSSPVPSLAGRRADLDPAVVALLGRALAKDPADRPPDAAAFRDALDALAEGRRPPDGAAPTTPTTPTTPLAAPTVALAAPVPPLTRPPAPPGDDGGRRRSVVLAVLAAVVLAGVLALLGYALAGRHHPAASPPTTGRTPPPATTAAPATKVSTTTTSTTTTTTSTTTTTTAPAPTPADEVASAQSATEQAVQQGGLDPHQARSVERQLEGISGDLSSGNDQAAANDTGTLIQFLGSLEQSGALTPSAFTSIVDPLDTLAGMLPPANGGSAAATATTTTTTTTTPPAAPGPTAPTAPGPGGPAGPGPGPGGA